MIPGERFDDRYELMSRAGAGGMGTVWQAKDRQSGQTVAVKILHEAQGEGVLRFRKEAQILSTLEHPHIVRYVSSAIAESGEPYIVMEWLEGESLLQRVERKGLSVEESVLVARHVAEALAVAHERGITHRDIKPSNLFLVQGDVDRVKILDFGIARLTGVTAATGGATRTGSILGTPGYMAPEQARGEREAGAPSDVFALGCVLFECLAGQPAFAGAHPMALLAKLLLEEPPRLSEIRADVPAALAVLCSRMLSKKPEERPANGAAVLEALAAYETQAPNNKIVALDPARGAITGTERRLISIVALSAPRGHDPRLGVPKELLTAVRRTAIPLGAHVEELVSGVLIAVLSGEGSVLDQAANAAFCATWLRLAAPLSHVALATGRGESTNRLPVGDALERAALLLDDLLTLGLENPHVRIDETTRALVESRFDVFEEQGRWFLRGERLATQETRTLLGKPSPFVGRERELRNILELCDESFEEERALVALVTAPSGTGKSRLRHELVRTLRARHSNLTVVMARPDAIGAGSAYALLSGALRDALAISAGELVETQMRKIELLAAMYQTEGDEPWIAEFLGELAGIPFPDEQSPLLRAARQSPQLMADRIEMAYIRVTAAIARTRSVLVVLEDLHWGDAPSLKVIDSALRDLFDQPFVVLAFARPEVHDVFPRLFSGRMVHEVRLGPLGRRAAVELVSSVLGDKATQEGALALVERAEGNAFYLEELIRAVADGREETLPETVLGMVEARLSALGPFARRLLRAASIFGEVFWASGVRALCGGMDAVDEALSEFLARELVVRRTQTRFVGQEEYVFRHAMIREGAYAMLTEEDRKLGHRLAGEWLEKAGELDALVLAEHYHRGGDLAWASAYFLKAGNQSFDRDDLPGALLCAQRGIACGAFGALTGNLHTLLSAVYCWRSEFSLAYAESLRALPLVEKGTRWECMLLFHSTWASLVMGEDAQFQLMAKRFVEFDPEPGAEKDYLLWAPLCASLLTTYGCKDLCESLLDRAEALADRVPVLDLSQIGALSIGRSDQVRAFERAPYRQLGLTTQAVEAFESIGDIRNQTTALNRLGQALAEVGDLEAGESALRRAVALARRIRGPFVSMQAALHLAALLARTREPSKWAEAEVTLGSVLSASGVSHGYRGWAYGLRAQILLRRGESEAALAEVAEAAPLCERVPLRKCWIMALEMEALLVCGRTADAVLRAPLLLAELASVGGGGYVEMEAKLVIVNAYWEAGERDEARRQVKDLLQSVSIRVADIADPAMRARYVLVLPEVVEANKVAARIL